MSRDLLTLIAFSVLVGVAVTAHLTTLVGLFRRSPIWPAFVALLLPPAAPFLAARAGMWVRAALSLLSIVGYAVARSVLTSLRGRSILRERGQALFGAGLLATV